MYLATPSFVPRLALQMCGQSGPSDRDKSFPSSLSTGDLFHAGKEAASSL